MRNRLRNRAFVFVLLTMAIAIPLPADELPSKEEGFFSDAAYTALKESGVEVEELKKRLSARDYEGAKEVLTKKQENEALDEKEDELVRLAADRIQKSSLRKIIKQEASEEEDYQETRVEKVVLEETPEVVASAGPAAQIQSVSQEVKPIEPEYDYKRLSDQGIRKLIPGMTIFRFAHHRMVSVKDLRKKVPPFRVAQHSSK